MINKNSTIIIMLVSMSFSGFAQKSDSLRFLLHKIETIENEKHLAQKEYEIYKTALDSDYKNAKVEVNNKLDLLLWFSGILGIGGLLVVLVFSVKYANKTAAKQIEIKLEKLFSDEKDKLIQLIYSQNEENQLKENKRILILSSKDTDDGFIKSFFKEMGFKKGSFEKISEYKKQKQPFDLIFFNNEDSKLSQEDIKKYVEESKPNTMFFHFGSVRFSDMDASNNKVAFANLRTQIYGNLINALRFQKFI